MPRREMGLMGYVGEAVVAHWLQHMYPSAQIISQIIPTGVPKKGGAYLDFGVINNGHVEAVYEVKSQDYIFDKAFAINQALQFMWNNPERILEFQTQEGKMYSGVPSTKAYIILLVGPNETGIQRIGTNNLKNVILFENIWNDIEETNIPEIIMRDIQIDVEKVLAILKSPVNGRRITPLFKLFRDQNK